MHYSRFSRKMALALWAPLLLAHTGCAKTCLWKASSGHGTLYLQGSVHLLKTNDYPLDPAIENAYDQSDVLILETDIKAMLSPETQQLIVSKALLPEYRTLKSELDPEVYGLLSKKLIDAGLPPIAMQQFKPWFATLTLMMARMTSMGFDPNLGLDQYFYRKATKDEKPVVGLETVEFQINLFDALAEGNQNAYTKHALKELEQLETMLDEITTAWKKGDLDKLDEVTKDSFKEYPGLYEKFVTSRNRTWTTKLDAMASEGKNCMVVVGIAHFAGESGLIELLKEKGYKIEQL